MECMQCSVHSTLSVYFILHLKKTNTLHMHLYKRPSSPTLLHSSRFPAPALTIPTPWKRFSNFIYSVQNMFLFHVILRFLYATPFSLHTPDPCADCHPPFRPNQCVGMLDVRDCAPFQHGVSLLVIWLDGWLRVLDIIHIHYGVGV
jgi:hypothetical protein